MSRNSVARGQYRNRLVTLEGEMCGMQIAMNYRRTQHVAKRAEVIPRNRRSAAEVSRLLLMLL